MSIQALAKRFVELCNQGKNFDVMREMYSDDIASVEAGGNATVGKTAVIQKSERWAAGLTIHGETVRGPFFHGQGEFAVIFNFDVTPKATGQRQTQEEVGVYTVKDGKIVKEQFYYEGNW
jgi:ketosteroid isomerase-like protein